jgi:hypothetical protein
MITSYKFVLGFPISFIVMPDFNPNNGQINLKWVLGLLLKNQQYVESKILFYKRLLFIIEYTIQKQQHKFCSMTPLK